MKARDVAFLMVFATLGLALGLLSPLGCPQGFDCESYFAMAADPSHLSGYLPPHAQRILPPLIVHLMTKVGIAVPAGFSILAVAGFIAISMFCYLSLRRYGGALESVAMTAWLWIVPWQFTLALFDVGQAGYLWAFVAMIGIAMAYEDGRPGVIALTGLLGAFCRQEVLIVTMTALLALAYRRRTWRPLLLGGLVGSMVLVAMMGIAKGGSHAFLTTRAHAVSPAVVGDTLASRHLLLSLWTFLPFVPVALVWAKPSGLGLGWIGVAAGLIAALDVTMLAVGPDNFARIAFLAIWPLWWLVARRLVTCRAHTAAWAVAALLPFTQPPLLRALEAAGAAPGYPAVSLAVGIIAPAAAAFFIWLSCSKTPGALSPVAPSHGQ